MSKKTLSVAFAVAAIGAFGVGSTTASAAVTAPNLSSFCAKAPVKLQAACNSAAVKLQPTANQIVTKINTRTTTSGTAFDLNSLIGNVSNLLKGFNLSSTNLSSLTGLASGLLGSSGKAPSVNLGSFGNLSSLLSGFLKK